MKRSTWRAHLPGILLGVGAALFLAMPVRAARPLVVVLPTTGIVDQVMASYVQGGISQAASEGAAAVIIEIDTPGGSLTSMHDIVKAILDAPLPVITWVAPSGSRAASAGTFITLAGNIALMAPGTNIGAASPVTSTGGDITGTEGQKVLNDAVASITAIAQQRGRNVDWAVSTVKSAVSSSATEAVSAGAVNGIAASLPDVLAFATGKTVTVGGREVTLDLQGATTTTLGMNPLQAFLHLLADPNLAFILFIVGAYGLVLEFVHPNLLSGTAGAVSLILSFIGFQYLPLNLAGLLLIAAGIVLLVLDLTVTSHGILTLGGLAAFVLGASVLYTQPGPGGGNIGVAWPLILVMTLATAGFMLVVLRAALRIRRWRPVGAVLGIGRGGRLAVGTLAEVRRPLEPVGSVYVLGEEWSARSAGDMPLDRGTTVRIVGQDGLTLVVERAEPVGTGTHLEVSPS